MELQYTSRHTPYETPSILLDNNSIHLNAYLQVCALCPSNILWDYTVDTIYNANYIPPNAYMKYWSSTIKAPWGAVSREKKNEYQAGQRFVIVNPERDSAKQQDNKLQLVHYLFSSLSFLKDLTSNLLLVPYGSTFTVTSLSILLLHGVSSTKSRRHHYQKKGILSPPQ